MMASSFFFPLLPLPFLKRLWEEMFLFSRFIGFIHRDYSRLKATLSMTDPFLPVSLSFHCFAGFIGLFSTDGLFLKSSRTHLISTFLHQMWKLLTSLRRFINSQPVISLSPSSSGDISLCTCDMKPSPWEELCRSSHLLVVQLRHEWRSKMKIHTEGGCGCGWVFFFFFCCCSCCIF